MLKTFLKTSFWAAFSALAVALPAGAFALTPQQALNLAVPATLKLVPSAMHGEFTMDITERALVAGGQSGTGQVHVSLKERKASASQNEGQMVLDRLNIVPATGQPSVGPDDPAAIQWKTVDQKSYFRLEKLPASAAAMLKAEGIDITPYVGQWILVDLKAIMNELGSNASLIATDNMPQSPLKQFLLANKLPLLLVMRVEKRLTDADGNKIFRARIRINPLAINALRLKELAAVAKDNPFRADEIASINKRYADLRSFLAKTQFVAEVNENTGVVRRLEMGGQSSTYNKTCAWNTRYQRNICKNTSLTTYKYAAGFSFLKDSGAPVTDEPNSMPIQDLINKLMPTPEASTSTESGVSTSTESEEY